MSIICTNNHVLHCRDSLQPWTGWRPGRSSSFSGERDNYPSYYSASGQYWRAAESTESCHVLLGLPWLICTVWPVGQARAGEDAGPSLLLMKSTPIVCNARRAGQLWLGCDGNLTGTNVYEIGYALCEYAAVTVAMGWVFVIIDRELPESFGVAQSLAGTGGP